MFSILPFHVFVEPIALTMLMPPKRLILARTAHDPSALARSATAFGQSSVSSAWLPRVVATSSSKGFAAKLQPESAWTSTELELQKGSSAKRD